MLTREEVKEIKELISEVPKKSAACIEALKVLLKSRKWVSDENINDLADLLKMTPEEVDGVATFYNLIFRKPVGRNVVLMCDSITCWVMGYEKNLDSFKMHHGIIFGETTPDDRFTLLPNACLGCCDHAPALMVNNDLHKSVSPSGLSKILDQYK